MLFVNSVKALATHAMVPGASKLTRKSDYFIPEKHDGLQAHLAEFSPGTLIRPHFHVQDQFQVFVWGSGRLGQHDLLPYTIHYVDKYSPYGPITVGDAGLAMFTLRPGKDSGAQFMPESKPNLKQRTRQRAGRQLTANVTLNPLDTLRLGSSTETRTMLGPHADGLATFLLRGGPNADVERPAVGGAGQIWVICNGSLLVGRENLPQWSMLFLSATSKAEPMQSGDAGLDAVVVQFPSGAGSGANTNEKTSSEGAPASNRQPIA